MTATNLDAACADLGHELGTMVAKHKTSKDTENSITKALGVLEEQGVYAMFLYLHAREKDLGAWFRQELMKFLRLEDVGLVPERGDNEPFGALQELAKNLDDLLFARDLLHQVLVYARYHAKAAQAANSGKPDSREDTRTPSKDANREGRPNQAQHGADGREEEAGK